ncbi:hypothetical protein N5T62_10415 [Aliarcobacter cryaerophilus]|uniref:hypothetical protein n=1 Tax=Aliarcobacter cryaerophilus TaxID=28198 RepID=UPI0021B27B11|nr:hypothetical protein [Aliarcobacter cryaerophilus]MCT7506491.1 hypothetical protein [Aliarcobacter cryaerophilus]
MENNALIKWLKNIQNDIINEEILYIKDIYIKPKSNIFDLSNYKGSRDYKNKNLISTSYINKFTLETILGNNLKIIYVKYDEKVLSKFEIFFKKIEINVEDEFKDIEFFLIERIKLQDVLNKENLYDFLQERRSILTNIFEEDNEVIFMEENFKVKANTIVSRNKRFYYSNMFFENFTLLQFDINILKNSNLLTSRLANYIYKICLLYVYSTDKSIGNKVHYTLEVGSKPYTFEFIKYRGLKSVNRGNIASSFFKKPIRCYDLTINENILEAKIRILKNLINLNLPHLDINKMVQIVELSNIEIKEIKDLELKSYIKRFKNSNTNL